MTPPLVLVTGASGGIGRALVQRLHARGVRIAVVGRDADRLADLPAALHLAADVTTPDGARRAVAETVRQLGLPVGLAHLVGSTLISPLHRTRAETWHELMRVNVDSTFFTLGAWIDALRADPDTARGASAVCVSSVVSRIGVANHEAIAAAKGAVEALVRSTAATYAGLGVRANAVAPGLTDTPMTAGLLKMPAMREAAGLQYPLGGVNAADDVAAVIDWLLSSDASRVTGQVLPVDGGFTQIRPLVK